MRALGIISLFAACASTPKAPQVTVEPPKALDTVAPQRIAAASDLDEAATRAKSRAFLDAVDHFDRRTFEDTAGVAFVYFAEQRFSSRDDVAARLADRSQRHLPVRSRVFGEEKVLTSPGSAIYIGQTTEHVPSDGEHPSAELEGWDTLVWTREGDRWRLAHWGWQVAGLDAERAVWDQVFAKGLGYTARPNQLLVDTVKGKKPGTALDLAMGQGRNAVFLAGAGWKVTGVDISEQGMRIAREAAAAKKLKLETVDVAMEKFEIGRDRWDLITLIYAGDDHALIEKAKLGLRKNGLFVVEFFAKGPQGGFAPGELASLFTAGFKILVDAEVEDVADWHGQRKERLARFVAQKL